VTTRRAVLGAAVALGALTGIGPTAAWAHPLLIQATPQPGVVADSSPPAIGLALSEPAVARGSQIRVFGPGDRRVAVGAVRGGDGRRTISVRPRSPLRSAVYAVRWSVLGDDGHIVTGAFRFGVAGADGAAPTGVETLSGAGGGRGSEQAATDGVVKLAGRWLGILAASLLFGGFVLLARLRRRAGHDDEDAAILQRAAPVAWALVAVAAAEGVIAAASSGTGGAPDLGLLTAGATGISDLVRAIVVAGVSGALVLLRSRSRVRGRLYLGGGAAVLLTYALSGHALSFPTFWALLDQGVHVLTAGLWLGGVGALALVTLRGGVPLAAGARALAPVAGAALGVAIVTGVLAAVREVDRWYFLRWSDYGRIVIVKAALVAVVALFAVFAWWRSRRADGPGPRPLLLRAETLGVVVIVALAAGLSGLAQGRGQPLPAQRGTLFPGPALATALLAQANAPVGLFPARTGANVVTVGIAPGQPTPAAVRVRLVCGGCGVAEVRAPLRRRGGLTWSAPVRLPSEGTWFAYVTVGRATAPPVQLAVGVPRADGAPPVPLLAVADVSGPYAERCRAHVIGLELAIARLNADGGLDGGRKVAPLVLDSGGTAAGAAAAAKRGLAAKPIASVGSCGTGAVAAVDAASRAGLPVVVGDPAVDPTAAANVYRHAADPYAQGVAFGQLVRNRILAAAHPGVRTIRAAVGRDLQGRRLLAGLREGLKASSAGEGVPVTPGPGPRLVVLEPGSLARLSDAELMRVLDLRRAAAFVVDGPSGGGPDADAIARVSAARGTDITPAVLLFSERVLSETFVRRAGTLGRIGAVQGVSEVATNTADAELYKSAVPLLFRGDLASVDGLRGYVAGLALRDALRDGIDAKAILAGLRQPRVFTNALLAPWSVRAPGAGSPNVVALQPQFLSPTLVPPSAGGEAKDTEYFPQGSWTVTSQAALGIVPGLSQPPVR
jgi:methionine-rich copper-binding protein CopC/ABC-type branched-subunit amino acid transport system substrate-binding protein